MLDFAAWACTFAANLLIGQARWRHGWLVLFIGLVLWGYIGVKARYRSRPIWGLVAGSTMSACLALWNWWTW